MEIPTLDGEEGIYLFIRDVRHIFKSDTTDIIESGSRGGVTILLKVLFV